MKPESVSDLKTGSVSDYNARRRVCARKTDEFKTQSNTHVAPG